METCKKNTSSVDPIVMPPIDERLTQEEVDKLPDGTKVYVKWSGGNGPFLYEIANMGDGWPHRAVKDTYTGEPNVKGGYLDFVGKEKPRTIVWMA